MPENSTIKLEVKVEDRNLKMEEEVKTVNQVLGGAMIVEDTSSKTIPTSDIAPPKRTSKFFDK